MVVIRRNSGSATGICASVKSLLVPLEGEPVLLPDSRMALVLFLSLFLELIAFERISGPRARLKLDNPLCSCLHVYCAPLAWLCYPEVLTDKLNYDGIRASGSCFC